jgi:hypothetical protein
VSLPRPPEDGRRPLVPARLALPGLAGVGPRSVVARIPADGLRRQLRMQVRERSSGRWPLPSSSASAAGAGRAPRPLHPVRDPCLPHVPHRPLPPKPGLAAVGVVVRVEGRQHLRGQLGVGHRQRWALGLLTGGAAAVATRPSTHLGPPGRAACSTAPLPLGTGASAEGVWIPVASLGRHRGMGIRQGTPRLGCSRHAFRIPLGVW